MFTSLVWEHIYTQQQIRSLSRLVVTKGCKMRAVCPVQSTHQYWMLLHGNSSICLLMDLRKRGEWDINHVASVYWPVNKSSRLVTAGSYYIPHSIIRRGSFLEWSTKSNCLRTGIRFSCNTFLMFRHPSTICNFGISLLNYLRKLPRLRITLWRHRFTMSGQPLKVIQHKNNYLVRIF